MEMFFMFSPSSLIFKKDLTWVQASYNDLEKQFVEEITSPAASPMPLVLRVLWIIYVNWKKWTRPNFK